MAIPDKYKIQRSGKTFVLYSGLLNAAHNRGLQSIETEIIQFGCKGNDNTWVVKATVKDKDGKVFMGIGDANPGNVGKNIVPHVPRMAETRAKARALRDLVNVGEAALEELGGDEESEPPRSRPTPISSAKGNRPLVTPENLEKLKTLAVELRGEDGVERLEKRIGTSLDRLTDEEALNWIERLDPEGVPNKLEK